MVLSSKRRIEVERKKTSFCRPLRQFIESKVSSALRRKRNNNTDTHSLTAWSTFISSGIQPASAAYFFYLAHLCLLESLVSLLSANFWILFTVLYFHLCFCLLHWHSFLSLSSWRKLFFFFLSYFGVVYISQYSSEQHCLYLLGVSNLIRPLR